MKNILFIVGSNRKESFNRQLAKLAEEYLGTKDDVKVSYLDYVDVPFINQDKEFPTPDAVKKAREEVENADGLWFFTPEYNMSYPGLVKNLVDWLSRSRVQNDYSSGTSIANKKCTISGIGGRNKTAGSRAKLEELLSFIKANPLLPSEGFAVNPTAFKTGVAELSDEDKARLYSQADRFLAFI